MSIPPARSRPAARFLILASLLAAAATLRAGSPQGPPTVKEFRSPNGRFVATSDPNTLITTVDRIDPKTGARSEVWSMYGWARLAELADDGDHLLIFAPLVNLVTRDQSLELPAMYWVERGALRKVVRVIDVVGNPKNLADTVSHRAWGIFLDPDPQGRFRVQTEDGSVFSINLSTGETEVSPKR